MIHIKTYFTKKTIVYFLLFLLVLLFSSEAKAQSEEENRFLAMYYKADELVISPTRTPKPISQVAENMAVITADQIRDMNVHSLAEVLDRVPGLFASFMGRDFFSPSLYHIQGSETRHVLVLVDGIEWNNPSSGDALTYMVPVGIIKRVEIIKGPASSAWGSSLGGVINVITKDTGDKVVPEASFQASFGKSNSREYSGQIKGKAGILSYFMYAGRMDTNGIKHSRSYDRNSFYGKFNLDPSEKISFGLTLGFSSPHTGDRLFRSAWLSQKFGSRTLFSRVSADICFTDALSFHAALYSYESDRSSDGTALGGGPTGSAGEIYQDGEYYQKKRGGDLRLVYEADFHTLVAGFEFDDGLYHNSTYSGTNLQLIGVPAYSRTSNDLEKWALYLNDTIVIRDVTITPGIRYDHDDITGSFVSPSLGLTYSPIDGTVFRASVSRGFTTPPLCYTETGGIFTDPNSSLDHETVWSYQAGFETTALKYVWVRGVFFRHELKDVLTKVLFGGGFPRYNDIYINSGESRRQGIELEAETVPFYNTSITLGYSFVHITPDNQEGADNMYTYSIGVRYHNKKHKLRAELFGHFVWWNKDEIYNADYNGFIWDFNLTKTVYQTEKIQTDFFLSARNLFNGSQYEVMGHENCDRWMEIGVRVLF